MDSVYDDRDRSIEEATKMDQSARYAGVRIVEENYSDKTDKTTTRTIFRGGAAKSDNAHKDDAPAPRSAPPGGTGREAVGKHQGKRKAKKTNLLIPVLILLVVVIGGLAALFGLQQLSSLK